MINSCHCNAIVQLLYMIKVCGHILPEDGCIFKTFDDNMREDECGFKACRISQPEARCVFRAYGGIRSEIGYFLSKLGIATGLGPDVYSELEMASYCEWKNCYLLPDEP